MKEFFVQDVKTAGKNSAGIFIFANLYGMVESFELFEIESLTRIVDLLWIFGLTGIIIAGYELIKDQVPSYWGRGSAFLASALLVAEMLTLAHPNMGIDTTGIYFFFFINLVGLYFASENVIKNIYRYLILGAGLFGVFFSGSDLFFDYEIPSAFEPFFIVIWIGFTVGFGYGNYDAFKRAEI